MTNFFKDVVYFLVMCVWFLLVHISIILLLLNNNDTYDTYTYMSCCGLSLLMLVVTNKKWFNDWDKRV